MSARALIVPAVISPPRFQTLRTLYRAFNDRDVDAVLAAMTADVDWPNEWEGGRLAGREAVRDYWARQWQEIDPTVEPTRFTERDDGTVATEVHQTVRSRDGEVIDEGDVVHVFAFTADLVSRMDVKHLAGVGGRKEGP